METTRREFMRQVGATLAGLLLSGCDIASRLNAPSAPPQTRAPAPYPTCYKPPAAPMPTNTPTPAFGNNERWRALRTCWLDLRDTRLQSPKDTDFSNDLRRRHTDALKTLVAAKELQADVADEIGVAFAQAIAHVQRQAGACCYEPMPPEYTPRQNLTTQAAALTEMAGRSNIDQSTVTRARAALERDMAWLSQFQAGKTPGKLESVAATPAEVEAAYILVELLLERK